MGLYQYIREAWKKPSEEQEKLNSERLIAWRQEPVTNRIDKPTRLDRARALGYKAKQGIIVVRQRVDRGGRMRETIRKGRRTAHRRHKMILGMNYQQVAEQRAAKKFTNCEVLNSYEVGKDGTHQWFEVILVDRTHPSVLADPSLKWVSNPANMGRVTRGLTSAARRSRGLMGKGKGYEKMRPSLRANSRRAK